MRPSKGEPLSVAVFNAVRATGALEHPIGRVVLARAYFLYKRYLEDPFFGLLRNHPSLVRGGDVLDVGANIGYNTKLFARHLSAGTRVHAFEPERWNADLLRAICRQEIAEGRVNAVESAVSSAPGTLQLELNPRHFADHRVTSARESNRQVVGVSAVQLDAFCRDQGVERVSLVKIDVQGHEFEVLKGMEEVLAKRLRGGVAFEVEEQGVRQAETLGFMAERGFTLFQIARNGSLREVDSTRSILFGQRGYADILASRDRSLR
jgi:FkbM family methyltransferase